MIAITTSSPQDSLSLLVAIIIIAIITIAITDSQLPLPICNHDSHY